MSEVFFAFEAVKTTIRSMNNQAGGSKKVNLTTKVLHNGRDPGSTLTTFFSAFLSASSDDKISMTVDRLRSIMTEQFAKLKDTTNESTSQLDIFSLWVFFRGAVVYISNPKYLLRSKYLSVLMKARGKQLGHFLHKKDLLDLFVDIPPNTWVSNFLSDPRVTDGSIDELFEFLGWRYTDKNLFYDTFKSEPDMSSFWPSVMGERFLHLCEDEVDESLLGNVSEEEEESQIGLGSSCLNSQDEADVIGRKESDEKSKEIVKKPISDRERERRRNANAKKRDKRKNSKASVGSVIPDKVENTDGDNVVSTPKKCTPVTDNNENFNTVVYSGESEHQSDPDDDEYQNLVSRYFNRPNDDPANQGKESTTVEDEVKQKIYVLLKETQSKPKSLLYLASYAQVRAAYDSCDISALADKFFKKPTARLLEEIYFNFLTRKAQKANIRSEADGEIPTLLDLKQLISDVDQKVSMVASAPLDVTSTMTQLYSKISDINTAIASKGQSLYGPSVPTGQPLVSDPVSTSKTSQVSVKKNEESSTKTLTMQEMLDLILGDDC